MSVQSPATLRIFCSMDVYRVFHCLTHWQFPQEIFFGNRLDVLAQALQAAKANTVHSREGNRERLKRRANAADINKGDHVIVLAPERLTLTSRFDPLWVVTRVRGTTLWLHQMESGRIRRVHREKVRLVDPNLAWDEVNPRPVRKQAKRRRYTCQQHVDNGQPVTAEPPSGCDQPERAGGQSAKNGSQRNAPLLRAPPLRLQKQTYLLQSQIPLRSSSRLAQKRHTLAPSPIDQKRARWAVISLVSAFTSP